MCCGTVNTSITEEQRLANIQKQKDLIKKYRSANSGVADAPGNNSVRLAEKIVQGLRMTADRYCSQESHCPEGYKCVSNKCVATT